MNKIVNIIVRLVLLILGVVLLNVFDITFTRGIVNIGNIILILKSLSAD